MATIYVSPKKTIYGSFEQQLLAPVELAIGSLDSAIIVDMPLSVPYSLLTAMSEELHTLEIKVPVSITPEGLVEVNLSVFNTPLIEAYGVEFYEI